jgi:hypothetical protein
MIFIVGSVVVGGKAEKEKERAIALSLSLSLGKREEGEAEKKSIEKLLELRGFLFCRLLSCALGRNG